MIASRNLFPRQLFEEIRYGPFLPLKTSELLPVCWRRKVTILQRGPPSTWPPHEQQLGLHNASLRHDVFPYSGIKQVIAVDQVAWSTRGVSRFFEYFCATDPSGDTFEGISMGSGRKS